MHSLFLSCILKVGLRAPSRRLSVVLSHVSNFSKSYKMAYPSVPKGSPATDNFRCFFKNEAGVVISPFHDIPLYADKEQNIFNMVVEIPRWSNAKMEICKEEDLNPIKQDIKKDKLRYVKNCFPHKGYIWNYGALPQTYEDPEHTTPDTNTKGDSDPLDVCEIGHKIHAQGTVVQVKTLGVMCLIDEGETDWKVIAIDVTDPLADKLNDVNDVEAHCPGLLVATYEWFKYYKVPDGKPVNEFAFEGKAKDNAYTLKVIEETHEQWKQLICGEAKSTIARANVSCETSPYLISAEDAEKILQAAPELGPAAEIGQDVNKWYYVIPSN